MAQEKIIIDIQIDKEGAQKRLIEIEKQLLANRKQQEALRKEIKKASDEGREIDNETIQALNELQSANKKLNAERAQSVKAIENESNSINALRAEISRLTAERNNLNLETVEGRARFEELTQTLKQHNEAVNESSKASGNFKDNIGNYEQALKNAEAELQKINATLNSIKGALDVVNEAFLLFNNTLRLLGTNIFTFIAGLLGIKLSIKDLIKQLTLLRLSLFTLGIGVIIAAFASLASFLFGTEKGSKALAVALAPLKSIFQNLFSIVASFGEAVFFVVEKAIGLFNSFAEYLGLSTKGVQDNVKALQQFEAQQAKIESQQARLKAEGEKLRVLRDDETKSFDDRIKASQKLGELLKQEQSTTIKFLKDRLAFEEKNLKTIPENLRTTEQIAKVEERRKELAEAEEDLAGRIAEQLNEQNSLVRDRVALQNELLQAQLDADIATGKIREGSIEALNTEIKVIQDKAKLEKSATKDIEAQRLIELKAQKEIADKRKEYTDKAIELSNEWKEKQKENRDKAFQEEVAGLELSLAKQSEGSNEALKIFADLQRRKAEIEITQNELTGKQSELVRFNAEQTINENAKKAYEEREKLRQEELKNVQEYAKLEEEAKRQQYENEQNLAIENAVKQNEILQEGLNRELETYANSFETKRAILESATLMQIENIKKAQEAEAILNEENFARRIEGLEIESVQYDLALQEYLNKREAIEEKYEKDVTNLKASEVEKRRELDKLEVESELSKVNAVISAVGAVGKALGAETGASKAAAFIATQVNAFQAGSNVFKTLTGLGVPFPLALAGGALAFGAGQKYANQVNAINTAVQSTATAFNPSLKFASGGRVPRGYEMANSSKDVDNTLVMVKPNEVILNESQQSALGGAETFRKIGVPGFASGGIVASQSLAQQVNGFDASLIMQAVREMPNPVVTVQDFNTVQNRVTVKESVATL